MKKLGRILGILICISTPSCNSAKDQSKLDEGHSQNYVQLLTRIEHAGKQYRRAVNLLRYASSSLERSLAEGHLELSRQFLEIEFQLADIESQQLAFRESSHPSVKSTPATTSDDLRYEKIAQEIWQLSAELDKAKAHFEKAREDLKKSTTPETFRRAQNALDLAQKEVMIADKRLDLAGSNLDIQDYQRKKSASKDLQTVSLADRMKLLKEELLGASTKSAAVATQQNKGPEPPMTQPTQGTRRGGLLVNIQDYLERRGKLQRLSRAKSQIQGLGESLNSSLDGQMQELEKQQLEHMTLNQKTASAYNQAYDLLRHGGKQEEVKGLLDQAEQEMKLSTNLDERKELTTRAIHLVREQKLLIQEDEGKISDWESIASDDANESFNRVANRTGILLAMIGLVLLISFYLKKLPYKFMREGKNAFYFRKLISFFSGLIIGVIVFVNFISDFGSISAVIGLAGAGLAIALQDPIVSLAGWFLIVGKFGVSVGDRVEINHVKGDVIDIGLLRVAVLEVGNWVSAEQATGRVVFFPNSFIFKNHYYNYSTGTSFIWDEIKLTLTYESDWKKAKQIAEHIALRVSQEFIAEANEKSELLARRFHINLGTLTPIVYVSIGESGVDLLLRYLTAIRKRRITNDQICREILVAFEGDLRLALAYPTRKSISEARMIPENPPASLEQEAPLKGTS